MRHKWLVTLILMLVLVLSACGQNGDGSAQGNTAPGDTQETAEPSAQDPDGQIIGRWVSDYDSGDSWTFLEDGTGIQVQSGETVPCEWRVETGAEDSILTMTFESVRTRDGSALQLKYTVRIDGDTLSAWAYPMMDPASGEPDTWKRDTSQ